MQLYNHSVVIIIRTCLMNRHLKERQKKRRRVILSSSKRSLSCKFLFFPKESNVLVLIHFQYMSLFLCENAEYKKNAKKDIKEREATLAVPEENLEIRMYHYQGDHVTICFSVSVCH